MVFIFDLKNTEFLDKPCSHALKKALKRSQKNKTTCLHLENQPNSDPLFHDYCVNVLKAHPTNGPKFVIKNYGDGFMQLTDPLVSLLKKVYPAIAQLDYSHRKRYVELVKHLIDVDLIMTHAPEYKELFSPQAIKPLLEEDRRHPLYYALIYLIQIYCEHFAALIITTGISDEMPEYLENFYSNLLEKVSGNLILVSIYQQYVPLQTNLSLTFISNNLGIANNTVRALMHYRYEPDQEFENNMLEFVFHEQGLQKASDIKELIDNYSLLDTGFKFSEIIKCYLLPASRSQNKAIEINTLVRESQKRIYLLCVCLGPYIQLDHLKKIYRYCFNRGYPKGVDYSALGLILDENFDIRYPNLATYEASKNNAMKDPQFRKTLKTLQNGRKDCSAISKHIETLFARRKTLPNVIEMHIHKAVASLYGLDIDLIPPLNKTHSNTFIQTRNDSDGEDNNEEDSISARSIEGIEDEEKGFIIDCFNEMIGYFSATIDIQSADNCGAIISQFLKSYNKDDKFEVMDKNILAMLNTKKPEEIPPPPFMQVSKELHPKIINLFVTLARYYYFTENYWLLRKVVILGFRLLWEKSEYAAIIETCLALILTRSAEIALKDIVEIELRYRELGDTSLLKRVEYYNQLRGSINSLVARVTKRLHDNPDLPQQALAWSMLGAIAGNFSMPYWDSWKLLMQAYERAILQKDYFNAILAFGNSLVLQYGAGVSLLLFKSNCEKFLKEAVKYSVLLPQSIINGFLTFVKCVMGDEVEVDSNPAMEGPNRFFENFNSFITLIEKEEYLTCVGFAKSVHHLEFENVNDNLRIGYNIRIEFLVLETFAILKCLDSFPDETKEQLIKRVKITAKLLDCYEQDFPDNFRIRNEFIRAEIARSEFSEEISGEKPMSILDQCATFNYILNLAKQSENAHYCRLIYKSRQEVYAALQEQALAESNEFALSNGITIPASISQPPTNNKPRKRSYTQLIDELKSKLNLHFILLFQVDKHGKVFFPNIVFYKNFDTLLFNISNHRKFWDSTLVRKIVDTKKIVSNLVVANGASQSTENGNGGNVIGVPIFATLDKIVVRAVLYLQAAEMVEVKKVHIFLCKMADDFCRVALRDVSALNFTMLEDPYLLERRGSNENNSSDSSPTLSPSSSRSRDERPHSPVLNTNSALLLPPKSTSGRRSSAPFLTASGRTANSEDKSTVSSNGLGLTLPASRYEHHANFTPSPSPRLRHIEPWADIDRMVNAITLRRGHTFFLNSFENATLDNSQTSREQSAGADVPLTIPKSRKVNSK